MAWHGMASGVCARSCTHLDCIHTLIWNTTHGMRTRWCMQADLGKDLLLRKQFELFVRDECTPQLEVTIHAAGVIRPEHCLDAGEKARGVSHKVCKDELKPRGMKLGQYKQGLG